MEGCDYRTQDGGLRYCTYKEQCSYKDNTLIKQELEKLDNGKYRFNEFPNCKKPADVIGPVETKTIDKVISE